MEVLLTKIPDQVSLAGFFINFLNPPHPIRTIHSLPHAHLRRRNRIGWV
jgi:hypothetical protein